jgi:2-dehydropantoate 2-reductase
MSVATKLLETKEAVKTAARSPFTYPATAFSFRPQCATTLRTGNSAYRRFAAVEVTMRLLIVGAGSTGGYFGARLAAAGRDVTFLVRPKRAETLRRTGLQIVSPHGNLTLQPRLLTADALHTPYDIVFLAVKGFQLESVLEDFAPAIGPATMIMPVLNGMRHMDMLGKRFAPHNVIGCALKIATTIDEAGRVVQLTKLQDLAYGERDGEMTDRILALHDFMQGAGFVPRLSHNIEREMWEKWVLLALIGAITCTMRGAIGEVEAQPGGEAFALRLLDEITNVVKAVGTPPSESFLNEARAQVTEAGSALASSMYRDVQTHQPVEVETILGDLVRHAQAARLDTPLLAAAYTHLSVYQAQHRNA